MAKIQVKTRTAMRCAVFGDPAEMSSTALPTYADMMKFYLLIQHKMKPTSTSKDPTVAEVADKVSNKIEQLWLKASVPIISHKRVVEKVRLYHDKYKNILKPFKSRQHDGSYLLKLRDFNLDASIKLFDIAACKCLESQLCKCAKDKKVPQEERAFLMDQRTSRKMMIGHVDIKGTKKLEKRLKRKAKEMFIKATKNRKTTSTAVSETLVQEDVDESCDDNGADAVDDSDDELRAVGTKVVASTKMRLPLPTVARECDRHGVSDRCAASIISAVLQDVGMINEHDSSMVVDKNKVRRERVKARRQLSRKYDGTLRGLYFDGRKDRTLTQVKTGRKYYRKTISEEHIVIVQEPNSLYAGHITPTGGDSKSIKQGIIDFLDKNNIDTDALIVIGCDGTNVNTGAVGGVIRLLEEHLNRPLQWLICMLHANELPLRHLINKVDGVTQGPKGFSGIIGQALMTCELLPVVQFEPIILENCPNLDVEVSTDQQYLYDICHAISAGICSPDLAARRPGPVVHSRWLTTASRILRLYVGTDDPSENLKILVTFIMKVYAPVWFLVKMQSSCAQGSKHLWRMIKFSRYLPADLRNIVDKVIQRNGYYGHSENILLCMLSDERQHIRELAFRRIMAARKETALNATTAVRQFRVPELNFEAEDYTELVDWQSIDRCSPPVMKDMSDIEIITCVESKAKDKVDYPRFPCHTQGTERCIKLVTQASAAVCGEERRDGFIHARLHSRKIMKRFNNKAEFRLQ